MRTILTCFVAAILAVISGRADAAWYEARSKHFIIYADDKPERLNRFAERLERFDQAVRRVREMEDLNLTDSNRLRVYVLRSEGAVSKLIGSSQALGMYQPRASGAVAFVPRSAGSAHDDWDLDTEQIFFHEYAHHLQLQYASLALPEWVVEGFAEFFATAEIDKDGSVLFGKFPKYRVWGLLDDSGLTMEQTLGGRFLTDYLTFDKSRRGQQEKYIAGIQNGLSPLDSAKPAFGDLKPFKRDFDRFSRGELTGIRVAANGLSIGTIALRPLNPGEAAIMPAHIRSTRGVNEKTAPDVAVDARKAAELYPTDPFVQAALAEAEYDAGNYAAAEAAANRALAADPKQVHALIYKGRAQMELAKAKPASANWDVVRGWFIKANRIDTENAEPLALFYRTFGEAGEKPTRNAVDALLYAVMVAPQDEGLRIMATRELLIEKRVKEAKEMLVPLAYRPHSSVEFRDGMMKIMAAISAGDSKAALDLLEKGPENPPAGNPESLRCPDRRAPPRPPRLDHPTLADGEIDQPDPRGRRDRQGNDRRFEPERPAREEGRSAELRLDQAMLVDARYRHVENLALGEIPRCVQPHRQPQAAGQHVRAAEQYTGLDRDRERRKPGRVRVEDVGNAKQRGGDGQRRPAPPEFLDPAKQDPAKRHFFHEARQNGDGHQLENEPRRVALANDGVDPGDGRDPDRRRHQPEADE
ncbi:MAG TPA: hypothetical protein VKC17_10245 [Sphingomicrobium sp.]|nr:hypothetical protein [Sphingomicrobium sp.]